MILLALACLLPASGPFGVSRYTFAAPAVWPKPRDVRSRGEGFALPGSATMVAGPAADRAAVAEVSRMLSAAGVLRIAHLTQPPLIASSDLTVYVGGPRETRATPGVLARLGAAMPPDLPAEGYVLATGIAGGAPLAVLAGADGAGTFYAAQTLRQLITTRQGRPWLPGAEVHDWPSFGVRGVIEGFYGTPWTDAQRLAQMDFLGQTKQNAYVYSPKDDPYLRERWRDLYPPAQLAALRTLIQRARANHVTFTYALSPGLSVCYSADADERAIIAKLQSLYDLGARSFTIPLDDISYTDWNCPQDRDTFGTGPEGAALAQSTLLNALQNDFIATHKGMDRLHTVPTEYYGLAGSPYQLMLARSLDPAVVVEWTGPDVVSTQIGAAQGGQAHDMFGHDILIWDNYPVNDYASDRLMLGPYAGREPGLAGTVLGVTANPMPEAAASRVALFTSGAFLWNPDGYDPDQAWVAALRDLGGSGPGADALGLLAENSRSSLLTPLGASATESESPPLQALIAAFWQAYRAGLGVDDAAAQLDGYFSRMAGAPDALERTLTDPDLRAEVGPWATKLAVYGRAGSDAVAMLLAKRAGDAGAAQRARSAVESELAQADALKSAQVCVGVCRPFLDGALGSTA